MMLGFEESNSRDAANSLMPETTANAKSASVVDQLADQRKEQKADAERKGKQVNEKK